MTEVHQAIVHLNTVEREELRLWLDACEEDAWDRQITADAASGRPDFLTRQAEGPQHERPTGALTTRAVLLSLGP